MRRISSGSPRQTIEWRMACSDTDIRQGGNFGNAPVPKPDTDRSGIIGRTWIFDGMHANARAEVRPLSSEREEVRGRATTSSRATLEFSNAIREQPDEAEAYYWIARAFLGRNQLPEAIASLRRAVDINPDHSAAQLKLAELMIRTRDEELLKDAEARVQKILTDNPGDEDALFTLAASQAQLGRVEEAEKFLNEALNRSPGHLRSEIALALIKVSQQDLPAAERILKKAIEQAPGSRMPRWLWQPYTVAWIVLRKPRPC